MIQGANDKKIFKDGMMVDVSDFLFHIFGLAALRKTIPWVNRDEAYKENFQEVLFLIHHTQLLSKN